MGGEQKERVEEQRVVGFILVVNSQASLPGKRATWEDAKAVRVTNKRVGRN